VGIVPFTYASSFVFTNENVAQTVTIFVHFAIAGIGSIATFIMRVIEQTMILGDRLHWWLKLVPSFCLTNPIMYMSSKERLFATRPELQADDMDISLVGGELMALACHFGFWCIVLILIEIGALSFLLKVPLLLKKNRIQPKTDLDLDEDVLAEEARVGSEVASAK